MKHVYQLTLALVCAVCALSIQAQVSFTTSNILNPISGSSSQDCVLDMNGDFLDDVVRITSTSNMYIDYQQPDGSFIQSQFAISVQTTPSWSICGGDLNGDGLNDLCLGGGSSVSFLLSADGGASYVGQNEADYIFSQRSTMADIDNDGNLDAFVCHDVDQSHPYRNDGIGNMVEDQDLIETVNMAGNYAAIWVDYDNDGDTDLFMTKCRQGSSPGDPERTNRMYRNNGDGSYSEVGDVVGMADNAQSWSTVFEDFNNDGDFDAFIVNHDFQNRLMENDGTGMFTDVILSSGIDANDLGAWESDGADFNNDGFMDIFAELDDELYLGNGDMTFTGQNLSFNDGALGDLNNDGFVDVVKGNTIYMNNGNDNNWVKIGLEGIQSNYNGIGARIEIYGDWGIQVREIRSGESFSPMSTLVAQFGLGTSTSINQIVIYWPSGVVTSIDDPEINMTYILPEAGCVAAPNQITVDGITSICPGETLTLTAAAGGVDYLWSNGADTQSITVSAAGTYSVIIYDNDECVSLSDNVVVNIVQDETPYVTIEGDAVICEGGEVILTSTIGANYTWSNNMSGQTIAVSETGDYWVMIDALCSDDQISSESVSVTVLDAADLPVADDVYTWGGLVTLEATGENLMWYETEDATTSIGEGPSIEVDVDMDVTYWVESNAVYGGELESGGLEDNTIGGGGIPASGGLLFFDVTEPFTLLQVTVYVTSEGGAGERTIQLFDESAQLIGEHIETFDIGTHVVDVNFDVPMGAGLSIGCVENNFFRNNDGVNYPYAIGTVGSITTSTFGSGYYYYFYDWKIQKEQMVCPSERVPVSVIITGVEDIAALNTLDVYPNPATEVLNVVLNFNQASHLTLSLTDVTGRTVISQEMGTVTGEQRIELPVQDLAAGVYNLNVLVGQQQVQRAIVVE
jgi:hypothetical protein